MKNITQFPTNNYFPNTGKKLFIILHGTAGGSSALAIAEYFKSTEGSSNPVSSHYIIGMEGEIVQCVDERNGAYGNGVVTNQSWLGNPNYYTISIEHVKQSKDNSDVLTIPQKQSSFELIRDICIRNNIAMQPADMKSGITGHFAIDPINRSRCPGNYPWDELWRYLAVGGVINMNAYQLQAMNDCWDSVLKNMVGGMTPKNTPIYQSWQSAYLQGKFYGPPVTHEYTSVNWQGQSITVQEFLRGRAEQSATNEVVWYV